MRRFLSALWIPFLACFLAGPLGSVRLDPNARVAGEGTTPEAGRQAEDQAGRPSTPVRLAPAPVEARVPVKRHGPPTLGLLPSVSASGPVLLPTSRTRLTAAPPVVRASSLP